MYFTDTDTFNRKIDIKKINPKYSFSEEGELKNSKKNGLWKTYVHFEIEMVEIGILKPGEERKRHGTGEFGKELFKEEEYLNGKLHGEYKSYYWGIVGDVIQEQGTYKDGLKHGEWKRFHDFNNKTFVVNFKNDIEHGPSYILTHCNRERKKVKEMECSYKNGKLHGNYRRYDTYRKKIIFDVNYKNGELHGYYRDYFQPNVGPVTIKKEGLMDNGKEIGTWYIYKEYGSRWYQKIEYLNENEKIVHSCSPLYGHLRETIYYKNGLGLNEKRYISSPYEVETKNKEIGELYEEFEYDYDENGEYIGRRQII